DAIVVVERLAICAFDSALMNDVIANPQSAHRSADESARESPTSLHRRPYRIQTYSNEARLRWASF
ncbi:MAG TPA: hypothetical protein VN715_17425, partial [Roseiarcus sp.]|nr:hypothetical protein [Roseiarcus sp.]